jgi:hypothetical protein
MCGDDGCGGTCGTCAAGQSCDGSGQCVAGCTPACSGMMCGDDGCGGTCGMCAAGQSCDAGGQCVAGGSCAHPVCQTGAALGGSCDSCATQICKRVSYCCNKKWDSQCVAEVRSICGTRC